MTGRIRIDRPRWRRRRARHLRSGDHPLLAELGESFVDRLQGVARRFPTVLVVGAARSVVERIAAGTEPERLILGDGSFPLAAAARRRGCSVVTDEEALPFAFGWADLAIGATTLHWTNDLVGALVQLRLCLKPDGLFLGAVPGGATLHELRECLAEAEAERTGGLGLRVAPTVQIRDLGDIMQRAGFAMPVADSETHLRDYPDLRSLMRDVRAFGESSAFEGPGTPLRRDVLARAESLYRARYPGRQGGIRATFEFLHMCGWAPHPDQPQPLRPGSATTRLADALGTEEITSGEPAMPAIAGAHENGSGGRER